jgi:hypothetical protein
MGKIAEKLLEGVLIFWVVIKYWRRKKQIARMIAYVLEYRGMKATTDATGIEYTWGGLKLYNPDIPGHTCLRVYVTSDSARVFLYEGKQIVACHLGVWVIDLEFMYKSCWKDNHAVYWSRYND